MGDVSSFSAVSISDLIYIIFGELVIPCQTGLENPDLMFLNMLHEVGYLGEVSLSRSTSKNLSGYLTFF